jgi:hypothetical protein
MPEDQRIEKREDLIDRGEYKRRGYQLPVVFQVSVKSRHLLHVTTSGAPDGSRLSEEVSPVMKVAVLSTLALLSTGLAARADFSYTAISKLTGGSVVSPGGTGTASKYYFKGQMMKSDTGEIATIIDFDSQTLTTVNNRLKTITVRSLGEVGAAAKVKDAQVKVDIKETGQQKPIRGYNAKELILTMDVSGTATQQVGAGRMQIEMDMWVSSDVPGAGEVRSFYKRNMERMPWAAMSGSLSPSMRSGIAEMQRKLAEIGGVQVLSVMKMKIPGGASAPATSNSIAEVTTEAGDFSTASVPDSVFAIPAGYQKVDPK